MTTQLARPELVVGAGSFTAAIDGAGHIVLEGELDVGGLVALRSVLDRICFEPADVLIDASGLTFIDSRAVAELLRFQLLAAAQHRDVRLLRSSTALTRVIDILDLGHILVAIDT